MAYRCRPLPQCVRWLSHLTNPAVAPSPSPIFSALKHFELPKAPTSPRGGRHPPADPADSTWAPPGPSLRPRLLSSAAPSSKAAPSLPTPAPSSPSLAPAGVPTPFPHETGPAHRRRQHNLGQDSNAPVYPPPRPREVVSEPRQRALVPDDALLRKSGLAARPPSRLDLELTSSAPTSWLRLRGPWGGSPASAAFSSPSTPARWAAEREEQKKRAETARRRAAWRRAQSPAQAEEVAPAPGAELAQAAPAGSSTGAAGAWDGWNAFSSRAAEAAASAYAPREPPSPLPWSRSADLLGRPDLMVTRRVEWANLLLGFEQENKYEVMDPRAGQVVGYIIERSNWLMRQVLRRRRHFSAKILDFGGQEVLFEVDRPFYFISSRMRVFRGAQEIGEIRGRWHLWRRNYDLYAGKKQFAEVENPGLWWWTFTLKDEEGNTLGVVDRNFRGLGYEAFTDAGQYLIRLGPPLASAGTTSQVSHHTPTGFTRQQTELASQQASHIPYLDVSRPLTLEERAVALAFAVSLDCDFFSRHSEGGGGWLPFLPFILTQE